MAESRQAPIYSQPDRCAIKYGQWFTIAWMSAEATIALIAAVRSHSVTLFAFGADSAIELLSAVTVLWRFSTVREQTEATASKITGWLLIALAMYITADSTYTLIAAVSKPQPSYVGIALLAAAGLIMPWLAHRKRQLAAVAESTSLRADAVQSSICGYMSWIALAGLLLSASLHISWADPIAALALLPIVLKEAKQSLKGHACCED